MFSASFKIFILVTATIIFCTVHADAVKAVDSNANCPAGFALKHLPHETDCSLFYVCLNGKAILKNCPSNLHFNKHISVCDHPENADCQKDTQEKTARETIDQCPSENPDQPVLLPHKKDCGKFYICDAGVPHLKSCQPGLHFNIALQACDYPENAGCDSGVNKKGRDGRHGGFDILCPLNEDGNPILRPHETDCRKFYTCSNGITLVHVCQNGLHFNAERQACDYPENAGCEKGVNKKGRDGRDGGFDILCPLNEDGNPILRPHEIDCRKFYTCSNGITLVHVCQNGLHFNAESQACDYPENAGCEKGVNNKGRDGKDGGFDILCPLNEDGNPILRPHEIDCRKFYTCSNGITLVHVCQHGLHFNAERQACDYPENAGCEKSVTTAPKGKLGKEIPDHNCPLGKDDKLLLMPHQTDCRKFYSCNKGSSHLLTCQTGLHFSPKLQACDYPENAGCETGVSKKDPREKVVKDDLSIVCSSVPKGKTVMVPNANDCSKFFICDSGDAHQKSCPAGLHFNTALQACDYPSNVQCDKMGVLRSVGEPSPFCPEVNGKIAVFYRHPSNCSIYYLCSNGLAYEFACPARLHFNLRLRKCDYEDNAMCPIGSGKNDSS